MGLTLSSDTGKAATVFLSHVRRSFQRYPSDYTGELVRLLDDIAVVTRMISSAVTEGAATMAYGSVGESPGDINSDYATRQLYRHLRNDGYCCIILSKDHEAPLTFPDYVPHGNYVVCISPLDYDATGATERSIAGTIFSVYKRRSSTSLPGRGLDLKQKTNDQVAAGYCCYSSATTLHYTMKHGVYSFVMHPVTLQYFLQPSTHLMFPESPTTVYCRRELLLNNSSEVAQRVKDMISKYSASTLTTGCLVGDLHMVLQNGGVLVADKAHLLCEAAPAALIVEEAGGAAVDANGTRILDLAIEEDHTETVTLIIGPRSTIEGLNLTSSAHAKQNGAAKLLDE